MSERPGRRRATGLVVCLLATTLLAAVAAVTGCTRSATPPAPQPSQPLGQPEAIATSAGPFRAGPVVPPASGAFLGAWVQPDRLTQRDRVEAVSTWEGALGRRLDIVNTYRRMDEPFFTDSDLTFTSKGSTLMISWAGADTRAVTLGRYDALIRDRARRVKAFGHPMLLRFRWEMDRPGLAASVWSPEDYVAAWRHVRDLFRAEGATNVSWVWCPTADGFAAGRAPAYYPGDDEVDWICVDVYAGSRLTGLGDLLRPFLRWASGHPAKPLMVGEFGVARAWGAPSRAAWLRNAALVFKANPQIRAVLYFESDPDNGDGTPQQQFSLEGDPEALAAFASLAREPYFNPARR